MTEAIQNNIQPNTQSMAQKPHVGILMPPNESKRPDLIPKSAPNYIAAQINHDFYDKKNKKLNINDTVQTPIGVKIILSIGVAGIAALGLKKGWGKISNLFKHKA